MKRPARVYEGESFVVSIGIILANEETTPLTQLPADLVDMNRGNVSIVIDAPAFDKDNKDPLMISSVSENNPEVWTTWLLHAKVSGRQIIRFRILSNTLTVGDFVTEMDVKKTLGLNAKQVFTIGFILMILSGLSSIISLMLKFLGK
jgi:hypothetical protein